MNDHENDMNIFDVTRAVDLMKHTVGLNEKYEKKRQFIPWRNYFDGQDDTLDKLTKLGYMNCHTGWVGEPVYQVNVKGFIWLQDYVSTEILLSVSSIRGLI